MDSDLTFNQAVSASLTDLFTFGSLNVNTTGVIGAGVLSAAYVNGGGTIVHQNQLKSGTVQVGGTSISLPSSYTYVGARTDWWAKNPATSANWTVGNLNSIIAGYKRVS